MIAALAGLQKAISLDALSPQKEIVRQFYKDMWDRADVSVLFKICHTDLTFRGSLGPALVGLDQVAKYVRWVTGSLEHYTSDILGLIEEGDQVAGKLRFHGIHRKPLFGEPPTGRHVWWYGAPTFTFSNGKIRDLWVLGDIHGLISSIKDGFVENLDFSLGLSRAGEV